MDDRKNFLRSRFNSYENKFNLKVPIQPQHESIFRGIAEKFKPAAPLTDDIKELVTEKDLNLCADKLILVCYNGDKLKLNTLNFYLLMNFLSNWKPYNEYISSLVNIESPTKLGVDFTSLTELTELRFKEDPDSSNRLARLYHVDILYISVSPRKRLFDKEFAAEVLELVAELRTHSGLITVINYFGTEKSFTDSIYKDYFIDLYLKKFSINKNNTFKTIKGSGTPSSSNPMIKKVSDEEVF